jgi:hypothetical protein
MKKLFIVFMLLVTAAANATTAYSPPLGGAQITISGGTQFVGMPLMNSAVAFDIVASCSGTVLSLGSVGTNLGAGLTTGMAYFVELTSGPTSTYVGDRFEVDVASTKATANNSITILSGSATNTLASLPSGAALTGFSIAVRPHVTLGQLFGTKNNQLMYGTTVVSTADQVLSLNPQSQAYDTYYFLRNSGGTIVQWTKVGGGSTNRDTLSILPGVGMAVIRNGSGSVTLTWIGEVRRNAFAQPLVVGNNLVSQPIPINGTPVQNLLTYANGFTGSTVSSAADKILVYSAGIFRTYYLLRNSGGTIEQWTLVGGGSTNYSNTSIIPAYGAVVLNKISADSNYLVPYTLSL